VEIVSILLEAGTCVEVPIGDILSALECVYNWGNEEIAKMLLDNGAKVNRPGTCRSVLPTAVGVGVQSLLGLLLNRGADPNSKDSRGLTSLQIAAKTGDL
jgi:ankyrin repeat protein